MKNPLIYILPARGMAFPDRLISSEGVRGELATAARFVQWRLAAGLVLYAIVSAALIDDAWPILALVVLRLGVDGRNARRRSAQLGLQAAIAVIGFLEHDRLTAGLSVGGELLIVLSVVVRRFCGAQINWLGSGFAAPLGTTNLPALDTSGEPTATAAVAITTAQAVLEERGVEDTPARLDGGRAVIAFGAKYFARLCGLGLWAALIAGVLLDRSLAISLLIAARLVVPGALRSGKSLGVRLGMLVLQAIIALVGYRTGAYLSASLSVGSELGMVLAVVGLRLVGVPIGWIGHALPKRQDAQRRRRL